MVSSANRVIFTANIQSLSSNIALLRAHLAVARPMIVLLVEAQIPADSIQRFQIKDYHALHFPSEQLPRAGAGRRRRTAGGGTVAYYHSSVTMCHLAALSLSRLHAPAHVDKPDYGRTSSVHWFEAHLPATAPLSSSAASTQRQTRTSTASRRGSMCQLHQRDQGLPAARAVHRRRLQPALAHLGPPDRASSRFVSVRAAAAQQGRPALPCSGPSGPDAAQHALRLDEGRGDEARVKLRARPVSPTAWP